MSPKGHEADQHGETPSLAHAINKSFFAKNHDADSEALSYLPGCKAGWRRRGYASIHMASGEE